jgi:hypothetical protein
VSLTQPAVLVCHGSSITQCHSPASLDQILPLPYGSVLRKPSADGLCARPHKTTTSPKRNIAKFTTHYNSVRRPTKQSNQPGAGRFPLFPHEMHQRGLRTLLVWPFLAGEGDRQPSLSGARPVARQTPHHWSRQTAFWTRSWRRGYCACVLD